MEQHNKPIQFITRRGYTLNVRAVSNLMIADKLATLEEPPVPTYSVTTKAGVQEFNHFHDPEHPERSTLKTDEHRAQWEDYQVKKRQYEYDRSRAMMLLYIQEGLIDPPLPTEEWRQKMLSYNIKNVPEGGEDLLLYFYEREIFGSQSDVMTFMIDIMQAGGDISEERINAIEASFCNTLSRLNNMGLQDTQGGMELQPDPGTAEGGEVLGGEAGGVLPAEPDRPGVYDSGVQGDGADASLRAGAEHEAVGEGQ